MGATPARTVCFDLDGTLTDPKLGITRSIRHALAALDQSASDDDDLTWCIGPPLLESFEKLLGDRQRAAAALVHYRERFGAIGLYENAVYPGIREALTSLTSAGHRLFVATSKPGVYAERIIEHFELTNCFEVVFGAELDGKRSDKTELLAWVVDRARLDPKTTTMIGDRAHDIIGGRNNCMTTVGVLYGYGTTVELESAGADQLCATPADLLQTLSITGLESAGRSAR